MGGLQASNDVFGGFKRCLFTEQKIILVSCTRRDMVGNVMLKEFKEMKFLDEKFACNR